MIRALLIMLAAAGILSSQVQTVLSTYLGGREYDEVLAATMDAKGAIYVAGQTFSRDFPVAGPQRTSCHIGSLGSCADAFIAKISPTGSGLVYSNYFGTGFSDEATGIAVTPEGEAWVVGNTDSGIFLLKLGPEGREEFLRTIPAYPAARATAITLDRLNNVYITGQTLASLPLLHPLQSHLGAPSCRAVGDTTAMSLDAFVMKFSNTGELLFSTYFGGNGNDIGMVIDTDVAGNIYVAGSTSSRDLTLLNAVQETYAGGEPVGAGQCEGGDGFVVKIKSDGSRLVYSTYSGTPAREQISAMHVSPEGYVTAVRSGPSGLLQIFNPEGALLWEELSDPTTSVARDRAGRIYMAVPGGYSLRTARGQSAEYRVQQSALQTAALYSASSGMVLLAGAVGSSGGLPLANPVQHGFGGVLDGAVTLVRSDPGCDAAVLVNAASYRGPYVAAQSLATLFGCGVETATTVRVTDAAGSSQNATIVGRAANQLNIVLPERLSPGSLAVAAERDGANVALSEAQVDATAPSLFTADGTGVGTAAALILRVAPDGTRTTIPLTVCGETGCEPAPIDLGTAVERNYLLLFGTGFRHAAVGEVTIHANGHELPVLGHAAQSEYAGLDQLNVELPQALAGTGTLELQLAVGETLANPVMILIR